MRIIIGLGNPGNKYSDTWHNLGFISVDRFAEKHELSFKAGKGRFYAASGFLNNEKIVIVKPATYMNLSGIAVSQVMNFYGVSSESIIVVYDDINLKMDNIRIREAGSAGGHNGLRSIINSLNTLQFNRVRIGFWTEGIGNVLRNNPQALPDLVLAKIPSVLKDRVVSTVNESVSAVEHILEKGIKSAMNTFNSTNSD